MTISKFATRLKELRQEKGVSQKQLADYLGVVQGTVSAWEVGTTSPNIDMLIDLSEYFNVSVDYLIMISDVKSPFLQYDKETAQLIEQLPFMQSFVIRDLVDFYTSNPANILSDLLILGFERDFVYAKASRDKQMFSRIVPLGISLRRKADDAKNIILEESRKQNPVLAKKIDLENARNNGLNEALSIVSESLNGFSTREEYERAKPIIENIYKRIFGRIVPGFEKENSTDEQSKKRSKPSKTVDD